MAFATTTVTEDMLPGGKNVVMGTFTNGASDTGGDITTGLGVVTWFQATVNSHVDTGGIKHTISGGTVTIVTGEGVDGTWIAFGD